MFSPVVRAPLTWCPGSACGSSASYCAMSAAVRASKAAQSASVYQLVSQPFPGSSGWSG